MCGPGDTPEIDTSFQDWTKEQARNARLEERRRQGRIGEGMREIEAIFEGGSYRPLIEPHGRYNPRTRYITEGGKRWQPIRNDETTGFRPYKTTAKGNYYRASDGNVYFQSKVDEGNWFKLGADGDWNGWDETTAPGTGGRPDPYKTTGQGRYYRSGDDAIFESTVDPGKWYHLEGGEWDSYREVSAPDWESAVQLEQGPGRRQQFRENRDDLRVRGRGREYAGTEPLLAERERAMRRYYLPQLNENFGDARDDLTFALSRAGLGVSTAANQKRSDLRQGFRREQAGVLSDIERDLSATRSSINDSRSAIEAQLRSSGDATAATDAALRSRSTFAEDAPELNPLTNTLLAFAQNIGQVRNGLQVGNIRRTAAGGGFEDQSRIVS